MCVRARVGVCACVVCVSTIFFSWHVPYDADSCFHIENRSNLVAVVVFLLKTVPISSLLLLFGVPVPVFVIVTVVVDVVFTLKTVPISA